MRSEVVRWESLITGHHRSISRVGQEEVMISLESKYDLISVDKYVACSNARTHLSKPIVAPFLPPTSLSTLPVDALTLVAVVLPQQQSWRRVD